MSESRSESLEELRVWSELTEKQICESSKEQPKMVSKVIPEERVWNCTEGSGQLVSYMKELFLELSFDREFL